MICFGNFGNETYEELLSSGASIFDCVMNLYYVGLRDITDACCFAYGFRTACLADFDFRFTFVRSFGVSAT